MRAVWRAIRYLAKIQSMLRPVASQVIKAVLPARAVLGECLAALALLSMRFNASACPAADAQTMVSAFNDWGSVLVMNLVPPTQNPGGGTVTLNASDASGASSFASPFHGSVFFRLVFP